MKAYGYRLIDHPADLYIEGYGRDYGQALCGILQGLMDQIVKHPPEGECKNNKITIEEEDLEYLIVDFLEEVLYRVQMYGYYVSDCNIKVFNNDKLEANLCFLKLNPDEFILEIKAVTWHGLEIKKDKELYRIRVLFDI